MKKLSIFLLILCVLTVLVACTEKKDPATSPSVAPSAEPSASHEMVPSDDLPSASMDLVPSLDVDPSASIEHPNTQGLTNE